jgi:cytochrome c553
MNTQAAPPWAEYVPQKNVPAPESISGPNKVETVTGSSKTYTNKQIDDLYNPPNWFPDTYTASAPSVVSHGDPKRNLMACASCHLFSGAGHPESAHIAALSANYIVQQLKDYKAGLRLAGDKRSPAPFMEGFAKQMTDQEMQEAANWFAGLQPVKWYEVVETSSVPLTYVNSLWARRMFGDGRIEPLGDRIVELPKDAKRTDDRDPRSGFVVYVPIGSLAKGKDLVRTGGGGKTTACISCHGTNLTVGVTKDIPAIAGLGATYLTRQLYAFKNGLRKSENAKIMKGIVSKLTEQDIIAISAYISSLDPTVH